MTNRHPDARSPVTVTPAELRRWPLPEAAADKESRGRVLVVGGTSATPGAVLLAAEAALRCGAGKLQVATVASVAAQVAVAVPEARVAALPQTGGGDISSRGADAVLELAQHCSAVLFGPGLLDVDGAVELLSAVLPDLPCTAVLDALAIAYLTDHPDGVAHLAGNAVLTPNRTELARTLKVEQDVVEQEPAQHTVRLAERTGAAVSCGGPVSWVAGARQGLWQVEDGGPGLGVSGSGDVKAGITLGMCARGAEPAQAAVWAEYLHGRAGERLAASVGRLGFLARELSGEVPHIVAELET